MARVAIAVASCPLALCPLALCACVFGWDDYDPREGTTTTTTTAQTGGGGAGGEGVGGGTVDSCGDGELGDGEDCDDGGTDDGDGCSGDCRVECPDMLDPTTFHCYVAIDADAEWGAARDSCGDFGSGFDLATISSQAEQDFVSTQTSIVDRLILDDNRAVLWLGGTDAAVEGEWIWADGDPFFANWVEGEPNNDATNGEDCAVYLNRDGLIGYDDRPCGEAYPHLCERPPVGR